MEAPRGVSRGAASCPAAAAACGSCGATAIAGRIESGMGPDRDERTEHGGVSPKKKKKNRNNFEIAVPRPLFLFVYIGLTACGATTCRTGWVVGESLLASRESDTHAPAHSLHALTHAAASWPAVPPASADASGLICDWVFMSPGWLLPGPKPAGVQGWGASGMMAGARDCWVLVSGFWLMVRHG